MRYLWFCLVLLACHEQRKYPIMEMDISVGAEGLRNQIDVSLKADPNNVDLLFKKLDIGQKLNWPDSETATINKIIELEGLNLELYELASDYFQVSRKYQDLLNLIDQWTEGALLSENDIKLKIIGLIGIGEMQSAKDLMWAMLQDNTQPKLLDFTANQYLAIGDTTMALFAFNKLARIDENHDELFQTYVPLLLETGYNKQAEKILLNARDYKIDFHLQLLLARAYQDQNIKRSIGILRDWERKEAFELLSRWYLNRRRLDSARYFSERLFALDSSLHVMLLQGEILEVSGNWYSALNLYQSILKADSTAEIAREREDVVKRNIAYLRKQREAAERMPIVDLESKKETENE